MAAQAESSPTTWHDRIFKEFFRRFLPEFMRLFFAEEAAHLNFDTLHFLDKELVINLPDQTLRITDVVAEVETLTGEKEVILVHVEIESNPQRRFPQRMFEYYALLRVLRQRPVLPIALILRPGVGGLAWQEYTEQLFGQALLTFRYGQVGIRDLPQGSYAAQDDPVAGALSMLMVADPVDIPLQKLTVLQNIIASGLTDGDKLFLIGLIATYLPTADLADSESEVMEQIADIELTIFERLEQKGLEKGIEKGREEGELLGQRLLLERLLTHKFGELPVEITQQIELISDDATFDSLVEQALTAATIDELTFLIPQADDDTNVVSA